MLPFSSLKNSVLLHYPVRRKGAKICPRGANECYILQHEVIITGQS